MTSLWRISQEHNIPVSFPVDLSKECGQTRGAWLLSAQISCIDAGNAPSSVRAVWTRALLLMLTDKALCKQTEAKLLVWKHLQLITQADGCFWNCLTWTSRREAGCWVESNQDLPFSACMVPTFVPCKLGSLASLLTNAPPDMRSYYPRFTVLVTHSKRMIMVVKVCIHVRA